MLENNAENEAIFGRIGKRWRESIDRVKEYDVREDEPTIDGEFIPWLSIIDVMMFNSVSVVKECLTSNYELI